MMSNGLAMTGRLSTNPVNLTRAPVNLNLVYCVYVNKYGIILLGYLDTIDVKSL
jgi:hypothetical protein